MEFKDKLTIQRKQNNYSQEQLADMVGVSRQSISKWETGESYPDMAKIIQLCKLLNCELPDLLDDGVISSANVDSPDLNKQTKGKMIIDYFNGFLEFVTKTYNMFINMTFKSKIVMLLELMFLFAILTAICALVQIGIISIIRPVIYLLPDGANYIISRIVTNILTSIIAIIGIIVFIHLFKIRYLDYYVTITDNKVFEQTIEEPIEDNINNSELIKSSTPKIIIRDPKHSSSRFIEFLANVLIVLFKIFVALLALPVVCSFVFFVAISAFTLVNISSGNGLVFLYVLIVLVGCGTLCGVIGIFAYNIVFNSKQPVKLFLISTISSLLLIGIGSGLTVNKISTFDSTVTNYKTEYALINDVKENTYLQFWTNDVEYIITDEVSGIKIEASVPEGYRFVVSSNDDVCYEPGNFVEHYYNFCSYMDYDNFFECLNTLTKHLKQGSLVDFNDSYNLGSVKVILSQENFDKLSINN